MTEDYAMRYTHDVHCNAGRYKPKWTAGTGCSCFKHEDITEPAKRSNRNVSLIVGSVTMGAVLLSGVAFWVYVFYKLFNLLLG